MKTKYKIGDIVRFKFTYRGSKKVTTGKITAIIDTDFSMRNYKTQLYTAEVGKDKKRFTVYECDIV